MAFCIVRNDITKMETDAIVNTANPKVRIGDGIDRAVYEAAGKDKLLKKREEIGEVSPGNSFITDGYDLKAKYIIHTVGSSWRGGNEGEEDILRQCYRSIFALVKENEIESISIPLLASGSYGYPKGIALRIALSEIEDFAKDYEDILIYLVVFDDKSYHLSSELYGDIDSYINQNYVEEKTDEEYLRNPRERYHSFAASASLGSAKPRKLFGFGLGKESSASFGAAASPRDESRILADAACIEPEADSEEEFEEISYKLIEPGTAISEEAEDRFKVEFKKERSLSDVMDNLDKNFMEMVYYFCDLRGITDAELQKRSWIDRKAFSKLRCGTSKNPSKNSALCMAIGLELSLDDTKDLLARAGYALSPCSKTDVIVQFYIERKVYNLYQINVTLDDYGEPPLGCFEKQK